MTRYPLLFIQCSREIRYAFCFEIVECELEIQLRIFLHNKFLCLHPLGVKSISCVARSRFLVDILTSRVSILSNEGRFATRFIT